MLETELAQLAAATTAVDTGKIPGQPESTLEGVNTVTTRWEKPPWKTSHSSYIEDLTRPKRGSWGELAPSVGRDTRTPMISCSIYDCYFEQAICDLGASVNIMPKAMFEKLNYPALSHIMMCVQLADSTI